MVEDETEETLVDVVGTDDDELEDDDRFDVMMNPEATMLSNNCYR